MTDRTAEAVDVSIRADLYDRIESRVADSEFDDASEYVDFVLAELLSQLEGGETADEDSSDDEVRNRLKELGYLE
jgi:Arc/MetJ-type ribon-helix-helix transcriptional regulator